MVVVSCDTLHEIKRSVVALEAHFHSRSPVSVGSGYHQISCSLKPVLEEVRESYLAALTSTDTIVISRGLVLADEAGLVDSGRGWRGWRAGNELLRTGALRFNGCRECKQEKKETVEACL